MLLQQPGSSPRAVLPSHSEIASMQAVETHHAELTAELEEVKEACAPLGSSYADRIIKRVQACMQHMLEPAHCAGFLLNPRIRNVHYFSSEVLEYHAWLVRQAKRYILTQTGFELDGPEYLLACRQFEDFHMQHGVFGDWGGVEGRACRRACSGDTGTIECAFWWSQYGARAPELQRCALRVMHMWSCDSPTKRNWAVHEGIHTKKRNRLNFEKVVQLVEITANMRLTEYRRAGCGYVLPWQRDEGMLDCQAGLELEPVSTGTRKGMTEEEIAQQVAPVTRDLIGASAPPAADAVFARRACIFCSYPRDDDSDEERAPDGVDDPALRIPCEIDEMHEEADDAEKEGEVAATEQEASTVGTTEEEVPVRVTTEEDVAAAAVEMEEEVAWEGDIAATMEREEEVAATATLASIPMYHDGADAEDHLVQRFIAEEVDPVVGDLTPCMAMELGISPPTGGAGSEMGTHFDFDMSMGAPPSCGGATSTDRAPSRHDGAGETGTQAPRERIEAASPDTTRDIMKRERTRLMTSSNPRAQAFAHALEEARRRETGEVGVQGGVVAMEDVMEGVRAEADDEAMQGGPKVVDVPVEGGPQAVDEVVHAGQGRDEGAGDARPMVQETATEGGAALGESLGAEGLGMPHGSRREQTIAEASARVVLLRKGGGPVTIEEDDPETVPAVREEDEDYKGEEESEEESESGDSGDDDDNEPPPPPPTGASRRSAALTSASARGRRRSTSDTRGGTRRESGKGKRGQ
ncbi:hypothetical protein CBR_g29475 [Chara braunii]|uniref:HAT C-terminal dimerisation domain-containing protein n=1 Tax=Chara braunii TaxID=69332 RepID=A0A388LAH3_CHABU|nr:hypothetical protein CBR_g29475 [Chara braunii]|eukprot:GBG79325.1 hypothetical protein CBR_g29475 [Chara braunii]